MGDGGSHASFLRGLAAHYSVEPHGVRANLGGEEDQEHTRRLLRLVMAPAVQETFFAAEPVRLMTLQNSIHPRLHSLSRKALAHRPAAIAGSYARSQSRGTCLSLALVGRLRYSDGARRDTWPNETR